MTTPDPHLDPTPSPHRQPMDDTRCLFVLGLERDGRALDPALLAAAREHAGAHPEVARTAAELARLSDAVAELPGLSTSPGFTERVLEARRRAGPPRQSVVQLGLRVAAAAAVVLALVLVHDAGRPESAAADSSVENQHFGSDVFRADPYAAPDLASGLRVLLPGPLDRAPVSDDPAAAGDAADHRDAEPPR